jgi:hypothetical protein
MLALAALTAAVWLGLMLRSERLHVEAVKTAFSSTPPSASTTDENLRRARDARRFVPDAETKLTEWLLLARARRFRAADALLYGVVRDEPANVQALSIMARSAHDRELRADARRRLARLRPPRS